jgi:hypothetical protein
VVAIAEHIASSIRDAIDRASCANLERADPCRASEVGGGFGDQVEMVGLDIKVNDTKVRAMRESDRVADRDDEYALAK